MARIDSGERGRGGHEISAGQPDRLPSAAPYCHSRAPLIGVFRDARKAPVNAVDDSLRGVRVIDRGEERELSRVGSPFPSSSWREGRNA